MPTPIFDSQPPVRSLRPAFTQSAPFPVRSFLLADSLPRYLLASSMPQARSNEISRRRSSFYSTAYKMVFPQLLCFENDPSFMGGVRVRVATLLPWRVFGDFHECICIPVKL